MLLFCVVLIVVLIIPAASFWLDKFLAFYSAMKRYHIGKWDTELNWEEAVVKRAQKWIDRMPVVRITDNSQYVLIDILKGRYRNATIQSWQFAELGMGLYEYAKYKSYEFSCDKFINKYIRQDGTWKIEIDKVDYALLAYFLLKISDDPIKIRSAMDKMLYIIEKNRCEDDMISYSQGSESNFRYVDTLGMVCPFLALYGERYGEPKYVNLSIKQIDEFRKNGMLAEMSIPSHAYVVDSNLPAGIYGWGRGTAWYFLALHDTWNIISDFDKKYKLENWMKEAAECYIQYQHEDGGFDTILQGGGQYDSSITAAMAFFYQTCANIYKSSKYERVSQKCFLKIRQVTMQSGAIDNCQGDTHGLGIFSQVYDIMPFAQGLVLRAFAAQGRTQ